MKRFLLPLVVVAAMMSIAACGGSDDAKPAAAGKPAAALSQADFAAKVPAALQDVGTFHAVVTSTDEDGPAVTTADLRVTSAGTDLAATTGEGVTVLRIGGKFYGNGDGLSTDDAKPWKMWDPAATSAQDPMAALTGVQLQIQSAAALTHELLAGAAYATKFSSAEGPAVEGTPMTEYTFTIDAPKAAEAKALGDYLTSAVVTAQKIKEVAAVVLIDKDNLPRKLDFTVGTAKESVQFSKFGDSVTITAPPAAQIDG